MPAHQYPEKFRQIGEADLTLASLKRTLAIDDMETKVDVDDDDHIHITTNTKYQLLPSSEKCILKSICNHSLSSTPPVPCLSGIIGICSKPFEKQLTSSDTSKEQSRLSMSKRDVEECLLPLLTEDEDPTMEIEITTYDPQGNEFEMVFKRWGSKLYVLTRGWKSFFLHHKLKEHQDFVTSWMFRNLNTHKLCFVITWRRLTIFAPLKKRRRN